MKTNLKTLTVLGAGFLLLGLSGVTAYAGGLVDISFEDETFSNPSVIDNQYWPLIPEKTFVYYTMPKVGDGCEVNYVWVKNEVPPVVIAGLETQEVQDWVYVDEDCDGNPDTLPTGDLYLSENTLDWYAQDDDGNVWYLGEWTEEYEYDDAGNLISTSTEGSWNADIPGAEAGIIMLADPMPGLFYQQEYLEDEAEDIAKVLRVNARVNLTFDNEINMDDYEDCVKTKEWSPLELGVIEHKYYCDGLLLLVNELHGGTMRTELVEIIIGPPPSAVTPTPPTPDF